MKIVESNGRSLVLTHSGELHGPFTLFINAEYSNPNTRASVTGGLRLLQVLLHSFSISLAHRAVEGRCLHPQEVGWLTNLAYRPLEEIEGMTPRILTRLVKTSGVAHSDRAGAVSRATASSRLLQVGLFLDWYCKKVLEPRIASSQARRDLAESYQAIVNELKTKIKRKPKHPTQLRSLPAERFKQLMKVAFCSPERLFDSGEGVCSTIKRDRAIFLLACEGLRPGAIGNLQVADFKGQYLQIMDNVGRRGEASTTGTPMQKGARSERIEYHSEYTLTLWPWTQEAVRDYLRIERSDLLARRVKNKSKGFLFLEVLGAGPIRNRKTLSLIFSKAGKKAKENGLLARESGDVYVKSEDYDLVAYTLRHSAATLFVKEKGSGDTAVSAMKARFGWSPSSNMPALYARRADMDAAAFDIEDLWVEMRSEMLKLR